MVIDRASRFVVAWASGPREQTLADEVARQTRERTVDRAGVPWVSDGWEPYAEVIPTVYRDPVPSGVREAWVILRLTPGVQLTQAIKHHQGRRLERVEVRATIGEAVAQPYPVHIERANGVLRDRLNCLTRKTHAFAKRTATWDAAFGLVLFEHNWLRPHIALRQPAPADDPVRRYVPRTPAMAIGLTDHRWTWQEFLTRPVYPC